ncbi:toprim domain-containing protein [Oxalobacter vibrioformis]|uniref:Toprim domain-containing protein n=1 Tax=Oxalobacter vibrioformis TaxID=933080 RepID=A0A9E9P2K6_9BURK|nr:toprim domain-containing protein [Oxalobacter vibrioformis]WAW09989.1 toprim domain-containing protein [Oxalobacter vibrioformis]
MSDSQYLHKTSCDNCGSSDANAVYDDGHTYCFSCEKRAGQSEGKSKVQREGVGHKEVSGDYVSLPARGISEETCRKFDYQVGKLSSGAIVQIANYYRDGHRRAQHLRDRDKNFSWINGTVKVELFGQHLWPSKGKRVVVTEGEIDAMSLSQLQDNKWPVVSISSGINKAAKDFRTNLEWLDSFDEVVICFDNDPPGTKAREQVQKAIEECASLFKPGKVKVAKLPLKDANEMLTAGRGKDLINAIWNANEFRPDGLVTVADILPEFDKEPQKGLPWFLPTLTDLTHGRLLGEAIGIGAGTGVGKTEFLAEQMAFDIFELGLRVGVLSFEQTPLDTLVRLAGKNLKKQLHINDGSWTQEERKAAVGPLDGKVMLYNSFGTADWGVVESKITYMALTEGIQIFYLDHLTALAAPSNERESLETLMAAMAGLAHRLQVIIHFVSHLATPDGKPHEEGGRVYIKHFKGSRAIGFWAHTLIGLERDQQAEDPEVKGETTVRLLKHRNDGRVVGSTIPIALHQEEWRLYEKERIEFQSTEKEMF